MDYRHILENLFDGLYLVDRQRRITFWNRAAETITGYSSEEVIGSDCADNILMHVDGCGDNLCQGLCPLARTLADGVSREAEIYLHHRDGHRLPVRVRISARRDESGQIIGAAELFQDISPQTAIRERLREMEGLALLDPLTRLGNRRYISEALKASLRELSRESTRKGTNGVLLFDLDDFKRINDSFGHATGDCFLQAVARTLIHNSRPFDIFGRWGGEEFVGVVRNVNSDNLKKIADHLRHLIANISLPHLPQARTTASIGATLMRPDDTVATVIDRADSLLYRSKDAGKDCVSCDCQQPPTDGAEGS